MSTRSITVANELDRYIAQLRQYPVLSQEEETRLARKWREEGDVQAAHTLVTSNLRFVVKIAYDYRGYGARLLDLIQEGSVGLMRAVKRFDPCRGYRLISYAVHWIRAEIHAFLMRTVKSIRLGTSRAHRKLFFKLRSLKGILSAKGIEEHDRVVELIADRTGVDKQAVEEMALRLCTNEVSLDRPVADAGPPFVDIVPSETLSQEELIAQLEQEADRTARLNTAMTRLKENERKVIEMRYLTDEPMRLREIGDALGFSKQRAAQIERRALEKLRGAFDDAA
jgi:RNA polymerase sigma-32 factor